MAPVTDADREDAPRGPGRRRAGTGKRVGIPSRMGT